MQRTLKISPSLAAGNLLNLEQEVAKLEQGGADAIHFDCMDGHFVPLLTIGVPVLEQVRKVTKLHLDVHIMVTNPDVVWKDYVDAGADTLIFPAESALHAHRLCQNIHASGRRAGVALNPATHWRHIQYLLPFVDQVTVMAVNPGYSRQQHIASMIAKVQALHEHAQSQKLTYEIQVDGGVNEHNVRSLFLAGADSVVAGGAVMSHPVFGPDFGSAIRKLKECAQMD